MRSGSPARCRQSPSSWAPSSTASFRRKELGRSICAPVGQSIPRLRRPPQSAATSATSIPPARIMSGDSFSALRISASAWSNRPSCAASPASSNERGGPESGKQSRLLPLDSRFSGFAQAAPSLAEVIADLRVVADPPLGLGERFYRLIVALQLNGQPARRLVQLEALREPLQPLPVNVGRQPAAGPRVRGSCPAPGNPLRVRLLGGRERVGILRSQLIFGFRVKVELVLQCGPGGRRRCCRSARSCTPALRSSWR